jgi:hypothetical protein
VPGHEKTKVFNLYLYNLRRHQFLYFFIYPLVHLLSGEIEVTANGPRVRVLTAWSGNTFIVNQAPAYASEGVIPIHCVKEGKDEWLLITKLVGASRTCMLESPVWRIAAELSLDEKINASLDVEVYIECNRKLS